MDNCTAFDSDFARYAVYFAPDAQSPLARFGNAWLGRDPQGDEQLTPPKLNGYDVAEISAFTKVPARYGFHATLKPPFYIKKDTSVATFSDTLLAILRRFSHVRVDRWQVRALENFVALVPAAPCPEIDTLAAALVEGLDDFRMQPTTEELARRRRNDLTPHQEALLEKWGYPYVMDAFRLHFTLSGPLPEPQLSALESALQARMAEVLGAYTFSDIAVFGEPKSGRNFKLLQRFPLGG
tara:strand:+ start:2377 stop:3093 length:717 start_codon:yes stop_codon:yes gene_type:complete